MYGGQDAVEEIAWDCDLCELEADHAGVAHDDGADLDQPRLQARQQPERNLVGQFGGLEDQAMVVGQCEQQIHLSGLAR